MARRASSQRLGKGCRLTDLLAACGYGGAGLRGVLGLGQGRPCVCVSKKCVLISDAAMSLSNAHAMAHARMHARRRADTGTPPTRAGGGERGLRQRNGAQRSSFAEAPWYGSSLGAARHRPAHGATVTCFFALPQFLSNSDSHISYNSPQIWALQNRQVPVAGRSAVKRGAAPRSPTKPCGSSAAARWLHGVGAGAH